MINILIADDHPIIRRGLRDILGSEPEFTVVGEAANAQEILAQLRSLKVDVLLMDITMPGRNGIEVLKDVHLEWPDLPVLMLSIHPEDQYAMRALKAGAVGYLTKESAPEELVGAVQKVLSEGRYVSPVMAQRLAAEAGNANKGSEVHSLLSDREYDVLLKIGSGLGVSQIASELSLSVKTVSTYRSRLLEKLQMDSNAALIRYVIENNLLS
ncbi:DNA-binding response regulator [candidate division BRC1 bacterium HGW-BRC1-1]|nr:MAG: DNA-binding response regulator [candidate division BRC1 bacterium HGW-BRC1-1]